MRITRSQQFFLLLVGVLAEGHLLGFGPWATHELKTEVSRYIAFAVLIFGVLVFATLALITAQPQSAVLQQARKVTLNVAGFAMVIFGIPVFASRVTRIEGELTDNFLILIPLAILIFAVLNKEGNPGKSLLQATKTIASLAAGVVAVAGVLVGFGAILVALGAKPLMEILLRSLFVVPLLFLAIGFIDWGMRLWGRKRGSERRLQIGLFARIPQWEAMDEAEVDAAWARMHQYPPGGRVVSGWRYRSSSAVRLECRDATGRRYMLHVVDSLPSPRTQWLAGLILYAAHAGPWDDRVKRSVDLFARVDCRWEPMTPSRAEEERALLGETAAAGGSEPGRVCRDCGSIRLDRTDAEGRAFQVLTNLPPGPEPRWFAGIFLVRTAGHPPESTAEAAPLDYSPQ